MIMISKIFFNFIKFCVVVCFFYYTAILFSTPFNAEVVGKPLILVILPSNSVILALQSIFLTNLLVSGIFFFNSHLTVSYLVFKTNSLVSILFTFASYSS